MFIARVGAGASNSEKVTFSVYAEKRLIFQGNALGPNDPPQIIRCALPAAGTLTLRVEGASGTGVWGEPSIVRR